MAESLELIAQRASDANPGAKTVSEVRTSVKGAFLFELRKLRGGEQSDRSHWPQETDDE